jgi:hypothetical protein
MPPFLWGRTANRGGTVFGHGWKRAEATIVERQPLRRHFGNGLGNDLAFLADIRPESGDAFRATIESPLPANNFWPPEVGATVSVLFNAKHEVKFDKDDDRTSVKAQWLATHPKHPRFEADVYGAPGRGRGATVNPGSDARSAIAPPIAGAAGVVSIEAIRAAAVQSIASGNVVNLAGGPARDAGDPAARLAKLEALKQQGLMTDDEYAAARQHIIDAT